MVENNISDPIYAANLELTMDCNLLCSHCGVGACAKSDSTKDELTFTEYKKIIDQLEAMGCKYILIAGGEPMLRPDFWDICKYMEDKKIQFSIFTNGTLIDQKSIEKFKQFKYLSYIRISYDYFDKKRFEQFRGLAYIKKIVEESILNLRKAGIKVGVGMTIMKDNIDDIEKIMFNSNKLGANFFRAVPVLPIGRASNIGIDKDFYADALSGFLSAGKKMQSLYFNTVILPDDLSDIGDSVLSKCPGGDRIISIDYQGYLKHCPISEDKSYDSIREKDLSELLIDLKQKTNNKKDELLNSSCGACNEKEICAGGCLIEKEARSLPYDSEYPACLKDVWKLAFEKLEQDKELRRLINNMVCMINTQSIYKIPVCFRSLPIWWQPLDGKIKKEDDYARV